MKLFLKKICTLFLAMICILPFYLPYSAFAAESNIQTKLNAILNEYPNGSYFSVNGQRCEHSQTSSCNNCSLSGILSTKGERMQDYARNCNTCWAFARYVQYRLYGWDSLYVQSPIHPNGLKSISSGATSEKSTFSSAKIGDVIWFYSQSSCSGNPGHMGIFMGADSNGIWLYDNNIHGSELYTGTVRYAYITYNNMPASTRRYCKIYRAGNYENVVDGSKDDVRQYTITFDPNGGSVSPSSKTLTMGTALTNMPTPTRNGYTFQGWAMDKIDPDGSGVSVTTIIAEGVWTFDKDTTLYAHWAKEPPTNPPQNTPPDIVKPTSFDRSGKFGENNTLTWGMDTSTGVLVLSGNGRMKDWSNAEYRPWANERNSITGVLIEDGIQNLGRYTIARCENMTAISIPESVTEIGDDAFLSSYSLEGIELPSGLTKIGDGAFSDCTALKSIMIPQNVNYIGNRAFQGCYNLESVYFCGNAPSYFGSNATEYYTGPYASQNVFRGCTNLTVYYPANSSGWDSIIKEYTNVTWKTWDPGNTSSPSSAPAWGTWSAWSTTPYSASSTREVETRQVKISDAYTEYRYGLWRNDDNAGWCPNYGAQFSSSNSSWYEAYSNWSTTRMYDTGKKAYCDGKNHNHTHVVGYDSGGKANWVIYSDDGTFTGWGRLYYYWEETRTIPAVYETQYRYRDLISA